MSDFKRIEEFAKVRRGASPRPIDDPKWFGGDIGWVRIIDVTRSKRYLRSTEQYLSPLGEARSVRVDKGDLIMSICATIGRPVIVDMAACIHDGFVQFYDITGADTDYLYYALQHAEQEFLGYGQHGTQANLNTTIVGRHRLFVPPLPQQRKIARILTTVDNLIEKTEALIAKYQAIKQGMMHDLFTRGVDEHGHLRLLYEEAPELYKQSELGWIPKEWEVARVTEIADQVTDGDHHTPIRASQGILLLSARNVLNGWLNLSDVDYVPTHEYERMIKRCYPQSGDILISCSGTIGRICAVPNNLTFALVRSVALVKLNKLRCLTRYAEWSFRSQMVQAQIGMAQLQAAQPNLFQGAICELHFSIPSLDEQLAISSRLDALEAAIRQEQEQLQKVGQMKTGLMQDLLTGKARVKVDEAEEVAHV